MVHLFLKVPNSAQFVHDLECGINICACAREKIKPILAPMTTSNDLWFKMLVLDEMMMLYCI